MIFFYLFLFVFSYFFFGANGATSHTVFTLNKIFFPRLYEVRILIMNIQLIRYHQSPQGIHSQLMVNGTPFCHAHEQGSSLRSHNQLSAGTYRCKCFASVLSPMTLKVCRQRGKAVMMFGWDANRQWQVGVILLGHADPTLPPEEQELTRQQEAFDAFTQHVYEAYAMGEPITLEVSLMHN